MTTGLQLGAVAAVAVGPFLAVLTYLVATTMTARDDLGRDDEPAAPPAAVDPVPGPALSSRTGSFS